MPRMKNEFVTGKLALISVFFLVCAALASVSGCGCTSSKPVRADSIKIQVSADENITLNGKLIQLAQLASGIKAAGGTEQTSILVSIPKNARQSLMVEISRELASKGLRRIAFTLPTQAESRAEDGSQPAADQSQQLPDKSKPAPKKATSQTRGHS